MGGGAAGGGPVVSLQPGSLQDPGEAVHPRPLADVAVVEGRRGAARRRRRRHYLHGEGPESQDRTVRVVIFSLLLTTAWKKSDVLTVGCWVTK